MTEILTEPRFGIGQRALLVETPDGNVLWDCVSLIDDETVAAIEARGGIAGLAPRWLTAHVDSSLLVESVSALPSPVVLEALPVPPDHGLGLDDDEAFSPPVIHLI